MTEEEMCLNCTKEECDNCMDVVQVGPNRLRIRGEVHHVKEICEWFGITLSTWKCYRWKKKLTDVEVYEYYSNRGNAYKRRYINIDGETVPIKEAAKRLGVSVTMLDTYIKRGMTPQEAYEYRKNYKDPHHYIYYAGKKLTIRQAAELLGRTPLTIYQRMYRHRISAQEAFERTIEWMNRREYDGRGRD